MLISSGFWYISYFLIGFTIYELTSIQSHEGKLKAEGNGWTHKPCDQTHKTNERKQRMNERTRYRMSEWTNPIIERAKNGKWTNGTIKRLQTRQPNKWLKYTYSFSNWRKPVPVRLRILKSFSVTPLRNRIIISRNWFDNSNERKPKEMVD